MYRKVWTIPDRVFDILDDYPEAVEVEVIRLIRAYHRFFDDHGTDNGFVVDGVSPQAQAVFWRVYDELHDADMRYTEKCVVLSENGLKGVEAKNKKKERKEAKKKWYRENREKVAQQRKNRREKVSNNMSNNSEVLSNTLSNNGTQSQADSRLQKTQANANRQYSLNNIPTLHSGILLEVGCGEKPSYAQEVVENITRARPQGETATQSISNQTGSLSCSKAEQPVSPSPFADGSEAVRGSLGQLRSDGSCGSRQYRQFGITAHYQSGRAAVAAGSAPRFGTSAGSARKVFAQTPVGNTKPSACGERKPDLLSAPHPPKEGEVLITKSFELDFDDPILQPYFRADRFLRGALQNWLIRNKIGCSVEKRWIAKQLVKFAKRQGKLKVLMGVEE